MTVASWVGYDLDGRTDINWLYSLIIRLREKRAALVDIRERFQKLRPSLGDASDMQRLVRQVIGKLDLAVSAVETQVRAAELANATASSGELL